MVLVVNATPGRFTPGKETRYPLYRRLGGPQCRSGSVRNISLPPPPPPQSGFDSRTVQPVYSEVHTAAIFTADVSTSYPM
jgi:hypothetical protein